MVKKKLVSKIAVVVLVFAVFFGVVGCDFLGGNFLPMYMTFAQSRVNLVDYLFDNYGVSWVFDLVAEYAHADIGGVDYSKVIVLTQTDLGRFLMFLDPESLVPQVIFRESDFDLWVSLGQGYVSSEPPSAPPTIISGSTIGFIVGTVVFDPTDLSGPLVHPMNTDPFSDFSQDFILRDDTNGFTYKVTGIGNEISMERYDGATSTAAPTPKFFDITSDTYQIYDVGWNSANGNVLLLISVYDSVLLAEIPYLVTLPSVTDLFNASRLKDVLGVSTTVFQPPSENIEALELDSSYLIISDRNSGRLVSYNFDGTEHQGFRFETDQTKLLSVDPGFNGEVRWWLMYDSSSGYLYKNRVWW